MFPLRDNTPRQTFPFMNYTIIAFTIFIFYLQITSPDFEVFIMRYGFIPSKFSVIDPSTWQYVIFSIFLHGGLFHIVSNLWFLRVFGDNVEDVLGHLRYLLFYVAGGVAAVFAQYVVAPEAQVPMIGASGAISAIAGAYFVYFRHSRVHTLVTLIFIWTIVDLPASVVLGYWFLTQVFSSLGTLAMVTDVNQGGVAFFAHVGGFIFGYIVAKLHRYKPAYQLE